MAESAVERRIVLITGAGASHKLGKGHDIPLMGTWSDTLCKDLDAQEAGLAARIGIRPGLAADELEGLMGRFLMWSSIQSLNEELVRLGGRDDQPPDHVHPMVHEWLNLGKRRTARVLRAIHVSMYREFGTDAIDRETAGRAYGALFKRLEVGADHVRLVCATTNYDPSLRLGLSRNGLNAETGFTQQEAARPVLTPERFRDTLWKNKEVVPVLHLHGAVGWYIKESEIVRYPENDPYNPTLGTPAVLLPAPQKLDLSFPMLSNLWAVFAEALATATHVLFLGHSLRDEPLVGAVRESPARPRVAIANPDAEEDKTMDFPRRPWAVGMTFGDTPDFDAEALDSWLTGDATAWFSKDLLAKAKKHGEP